VWATAVIMALVAGGTAAAAAPSRIAGAIDAADTAPLTAAAQPRLRLARDLGPLPAHTRIENVTLHFKPSPAQQAELDALLEAQYTPGSPLYHRWLTPAAFGSRFGIGDDDLLKIRRWLSAQGLAVGALSAGRTQLAVSGSAAGIERALGVELHRYEYHGKLHFAAAGSPRLPVALSGIVQAVRNLDDFRPEPRVHVKRALAEGAPLPQFTTSDGKTHFLAPQDVATIYDIQPLYQRGIEGDSVNIAVVGQTEINLSDIRAFRAAAGLPANDPVLALVPGSGASVKLTGSEDLFESHLDLEWAGAIAPKSGLIFVYTGDSPNYSVFDALSYAIDQDLAPIISVSYGTCEDNLSSAELSSFRTLAQQANAQGQTIVAASGDSGGADCEPHGDPTVTKATTGLSVDFPAVLPEVTGVGGSAFIGDLGTGTTSSYWNLTNTSGYGSALSYIPEGAWNDSGSAGLLAGGGGASKKLAKPSWQAGLHVPDDNARDVPDIAFSASAFHDGYFVCSSGSCTNGFANSQGSILLAGGTSVSAPVFAGALALLERSSGSNGEGNFNPVLYTLASDYQTYLRVFNDIASGSNKVPCQTGTPDCTAGSIGYDAGSNYDQATGLGSINVSLMADAIGGTPLILTKSKLTVSPARVQKAGWVELKVIVSPERNLGVLGGTVQFFLDHTRIGTPIAVVGGKATLRITLYDLGVHSVTAVYSGDSTYATSEETQSVAVLAQSPAIESKSGGGGSLSPWVLAMLGLIALARRRFRTGREGCP
jgi:subtilase family serine protease